MAILPKTDKSEKRLEIDLTGPDGNAFVLMSYARRLGIQYCESSEDVDKIIDDMKSGDYEHLLEVMEQNFGDYIIMYR